MGELGGELGGEEGDKLVGVVVEKNLIWSAYLSCFSGHG